MGFYYGSKQRKHSSEDTGPVITPREYIELLGRELRMVIGPYDSDSYRPGIAEAAAAAASGLLLHELSTRVQRHPGDSAGHRMLAIAHLHAGNCKPALRHLEIAVNILRAQAATKGCLHRTLSARLELALLVPMMVRLCVRLGKQEMVRLIGELLLAW